LPDAFDGDRQGHDEPVRAEGVLSGGTCLVPPCRAVAYPRRDQLELSRHTAKSAAMSLSWQLRFCIRWRPQWRGGEDFFIKRGWAVKVNVEFLPVNFCQ